MVPSSQHIGRWIERDLVIVEGGRAFHGIRFPSWCIVGPNSNGAISVIGATQWLMIFALRQPHSSYASCQTTQTLVPRKSKTDVVSTTFFTLACDKAKKFVDWFGYGASVSPVAI